MKDFTNKYTNDSEQKILIRKINDLINISEKTYSVTYSHFLTPAEQTLISNILEFKGFISFDGGYDYAERRICCISANEYCLKNDIPINLYSLIVKKANISHRDVLGSLMGLGIKREMIGDIIISDNRYQFFCHNSVSSFILYNLKKIGKYNVTIVEDRLSEIPKTKTQDLTINVSSMRLDSVTAECFGISRTKIAEFIKSGNVSLNWLVQTDISKEIKSGDKISLRGKGKVEICDILGISKKGRLFVSVKKYI